MANIKNFGLVGVGSDVQFGKSGPRLINEAGVFKFKNAANTAFADASFNSITAEALKDQAGKMVTVDATGKLILGGLADALATDAEVEAIRAVLAQATADEATRAAGVEGALQSELDATQTGAGLSDTGAYVAETASNYINGATSLKAADFILDAAVKAANARIDSLGTGTIADLQAELDRTQTAVGVDATGNFVTLVGKNYIDAATSVMSAVELLDAAVKVRADAIAQEALDRASADTALRNEMQTAIAGLTWENPVKQMVADVAARDALVLVDGDRVFVAADNTIYTKTSTGFTSELMVQGAAFFDKETTVPYVFNGTTMVQFNGAAGLTAGLGLILNGNTMDLDLSANGGLMFFPDAGNPNNTVGIKIADASLEVGLTGLKLSAALQTEITALRTDLGAEVTRATGAESALDTRMTAVEGKNTTQDGRLDALELKTSADSGALQVEIDKIESSLGLAADGGLQLWANGNYFVAGSAATAESAPGANDGQAAVAPDTYKSAIEKIDAALKAMDVAYKAADAIVLTDAKAYTDARETSILTYVDGQVSTLRTEIATAKSEAITAANSYTDSKISEQIGASNVARAVYASFAGANAVIGTVKGFVHRVKVYLNVAAATDSAVQVGTSTVNNDVTTTSDVDSSVAGLYTVEVNKMYGADTQLSIFVGDVAAAGTVVVEYLA